MEQQKVRYMGVAYGFRGSVPLTTFDQSIVPPNFFRVAHKLGYRLQVTGGNDFTHEVEASPEDFNAIIALAMEA